MLKLIDNRTLLFATALIGGTFAPLMLLVRRTRRTYPGFGHWALGLACFAGAAFLQGLRGSVNDFFPVIVANAFAFFGLVAYCEGLHRFSEKQWPVSLAYGGAAVALAALYWFRYIHPDERVRISVFTAFELTILAYCARPFLGPAPKGRRLSYRFSAAVFLVSAFALVFRLLEGFFSPERTVGLAVTIANSLFFLSNLLTMVGAVFAAFLLTWDRLVRDLHEANRSLATESAERLRMEKRVADTERMETIARLAGGMAHYLNNQLCVINGYCRLLLDSMEMPPPVRAKVEIIGKTGENTAELTDRLLALSQVKLLTPSPLCLARWIGEIAPQIRAELGDAIALQLPIASDTTVVVDRDGLARTLLAMARNAREAMPQGGELSLATAEVHLDDAAQCQEFGLQPARYACLVVRDTGVGMEDRVRRRVFEPFFTTKGLACAEGLSLAGALGFARQSGGTIAVDSAAGAGTTFRIFLPLAR